MFLEQFLIVHKNWKPVDPGQSTEAAASAFLPVECSQNDDVMFGCSAGHPAEITLALTEEISHITAMVSQCKSDYISMQLKFSCELFVELRKRVAPFFAISVFDTSY